MLPASAVPVISGVVSLVIVGDSNVGALGAVVSVKFIGEEEKDKVPVPYNKKSDDPIGDPAIAPE